MKKHKRGVILAEADSTRWMESLGEGKKKPQKVEYLILGDTYRWLWGEERHSCRKRKKEY